MVERRPEEPCVGGPIPSRGTYQHDTRASKFICLRGGIGSRSVARACPKDKASAARRGREIFPSGNIFVANSLPRHQTMLLCYNTVNAYFLSHGTTKPIIRRGACGSLRDPPQKRNTPWNKPAKPTNQNKRLTYRIYSQVRIYKKRNPPSLYSNGNYRNYFYNCIFNVIK